MGTVTLFGGNFLRAFESSIQILNTAVTFSEGGNFLRGRRGNTTRPTNRRLNFLQLFLAIVSPFVEKSVDNTNSMIYENSSDRFLILPLMLHLMFFDMI